jgi:predicted RNase H-like HicB family nuclease
MMQVVALIDEDDGAYGVSFPDFPGCTTVADNLDAAVAKAAEVLAFHVEGLAEDGPVPGPRSLAELARDPEFRADFKNAFAALVPYHPPTRAVRVNITLEESLMERVDRAAGQVGETRSGYLAEAAKRRLAADAASGSFVPASGKRESVTLGRAAVVRTKLRPRRIKVGR